MGSKFLPLPALKRKSPGRRKKKPGPMEAAFAMAVKSSAWRGHRIAWGDVMLVEERRVQKGECSLCGAMVFLKETPGPDGSRINGDAVNTFCHENQEKADE